MQFIGVGLYVKNSIEAVPTYMEALGLSLGYHVLNDDGSYYHSELYRGEEEILSVVEASVEVSGQSTVQLSFLFDDEAELRHAYDVLSKGANLLFPLGEMPWSPLAADLIDRFGVRWYLTLPQHQPPETFRPEDF